MHPPKNFQISSGQEHVDQLLRTRVNSCHSREERGLDCYWTPPEATRALMAIERLPVSIADPCCGSGAILNVLAAAGYITIGSDVVDYGWPNTILRDYLATPLVMNLTGIVSNPPYLLAAEFLAKAISDGAIYHAWLLRLNFLESVSRKAFFEEHQPSRIWVSSRRLPMMHREGWQGQKATSNVTYAWFVWDRLSKDRGVVRWFDWKETEGSASTTTRGCERCGARIFKTARADARFCSGRCKVAAHRAGKRYADALTVTHEAC